MANTLNIGVDFFYPKAYDKSFEDKVFIILLPFFYSEEKDLQNSREEIHKYVKSYFTKDDIDWSYKVPKVEEAVDLVFVPFKPKTTIKLTPTNGSLIERKIGSNKAGEEPDWPKIAEWNNLKFPKLLNPTTEGDGKEPWIWEESTDNKTRLDEQEIKLLEEWAIELLDDHFSGRKKVSEELANFIEPIFKDSYEAIKQGNKTREAWRKNVLQSDRKDPKVNILSLYQKVAELMISGENYSIPQFFYSRKDLERDELKKIIFNESNDSYAEHYWRLFHEKIEGSVNDPEALDEVIQSMMLSLFQGERLRWNLPMSEHDMKVDEVDEEVKESYWTNIQSKLGLVFAFDRQEAEEIKNFDLTIKGVKEDSSDIKLNFPKYEWRSFVKECGKLANDPTDKSSEFKLLLKTPQTALNSPGRVRFKPKTTLYDKLEDTPENINALSVPLTILDALKGELTYETGLIRKKENAKLINQIGQRKSLKIKELFDDEDSQRNIVNEKGALLLKAQVSKIALFNNEKDNEYILRIRYDEEETLDQGFIGYIKDLFQRPISESSTDGIATRIWFTHEIGDSKTTKEVIIEKSHFLNTHEDNLGFDLKASADNNLMELLKWVEGASDSQGKEQNKPRVNLVFQRKSIHRFNLLLNESDERLLVLSKFYEFDFYNSTEHLYRRFKIGYEHPENDFDGTSTDFYNFKKAWVWLRQENDQEIKINETDHLLERNIPLDPTDWDNENFSDSIERAFELQHEFNNKISLKSKHADLLLDQERDRFNMFYHARDPWAMVVGLDHMYGYRIKTKQKRYRKIPVTTPVAHPADQQISLANNDSEGKASEIKIPMLNYKIELSESSEDEDLIIKFNRKYFQEVLKTEQSGEKEKSKLLRRSFYETVLDLLIGGPADNVPAKNSLKLVLERWNFDNTLARKDSMRGQLNEFPSIVDAMRYENTWVFDFDKALANGHNECVKWRQNLNELLPQGYDDLDENLRIIIKDPNHFSEKFSFRFPLTTTDNKGGWEIREGFDQTPRSVIDQDLNISKSTNLIRLGLEIQRESSRVPVTAENQLEVRKDDLYPILFDPVNNNAGQNEQNIIKGLPESFRITSEEWNPDPSTRYAKGYQVIGLDGNVYRSTKDDNAAPAIYDPSSTSLPWQLDNNNLLDPKMDKIREDLVEKVESVLAEDGDIATRFAWLPAEPRNVEKSASESNTGNEDPYYDKDRISKLMGPLASTVHVPDEVKDPGKDAKLYHIPIAFAPLPAQKELKDQRSTNDFFKFFLQTLQELAEGTNPSLIKLDSTNISLKDKLRITDNAKNQRNWVAEVLAKKYLTIVEDDDLGINENCDVDYHCPELRDWKGYRTNNGGDTSKDVSEQRALLEKVRTLRTKVFGSVRSEVMNLLNQDLTSYARNKGYGLNILDDVESNQSLYNLLIPKLVYHEVLFKLIHFKKKIDSNGNPLKRSYTVDEIVRAIKLSTDEVCKLFSKELQKYAQLDIIEQLNSVIKNVEWSLSDEPFKNHLNNHRFVEHRKEISRIEAFDPGNDLSESSWRAIKKNLQLRKTRLMVDTIIMSVNKESEVIPFFRADTDKFNFNSFSNIHYPDGSFNQFFIEELDDKSYDSEYEIIPSLTLGRTAEDVLEQKNRFDQELRKTAIQVKVEPHNPEWREWKPLKGQPSKYEEQRAYYILPSRISPARPVFIQQDSKDTNDELMNLSNKSHLLPLLPKGEDPQDYWGNNAATWFKLANRGLQIDGNDLKQADKGNPIVKRTIPKNWQCLESYVSHYHFVIDPDEEGVESSNPLDGFRNDTFRIQLEEATLDMDFSSSKQNSEKIPEVIKKSKIYKWFEYHRSLLTKTGESNEPVKVPEYLKTEHLLGGGNGTPNELEMIRELIPTEVPRIKKEKNTEVVRLSLNGDELVVKENNNSGLSGSMERPNVIDAHIMTYDVEEGEITSTKYVLRISILCSAWKKYRLRLRVDRNTRDVDHDGDSDMNPRFKMQSEYSNWASNEPYQVVRNYETLPEELKSVLKHKSGISRKEWWELGENQGRDRFNDPILYTIKETNKFWLNGSELSTWPLHQVVAVHKNSQRNQTYKYDGLKKLNPRDHNVVRSIGTDTAGKGGTDQHYLNLFSMSKKELPTVSIASTLTWSYTSKGKGPDSKEEQSYKVLTIENWEFSWKES